MWFFKRLRSDDESSILDYLRSIKRFCYPRLDQEPILSPLELLPPEIQLNIAQNLRDKDRSALKRTCKYFENLLVDTTIYVTVAIPKTKIKDDVSITFQLLSNDLISEPKSNLFSPQWRTEIFFDFLKAKEWLKKNFHLKRDDFFKMSSLGILKIINVPEEKILTLANYQGRQIDSTHCIKLEDLSELVIRYESKENNKKRLLKNPACKPNEEKTSYLPRFC